MALLLAKELKLHRAEITGSAGVEERCDGGGEEMRPVADRGGWGLQHFQKLLE